MFLISWSVCALSKVCAYPRVEDLKRAPHKHFSALLENIKLDWKGLPGINTLVYYEHS